MIVLFVIVPRYGLDEIKRGFFPFLIFFLAYLIFFPFVVMFSETYLALWTHVVDAVWLQHNCGCW